MQLDNANLSTSHNAPVLKSPEKSQNISTSDADAKSNLPPPMPEETKLEKIIKEQSSQLITLVNIVNAFNKENDMLNTTIKSKNIDIQNLQDEKTEIEKLFNLQTMLFVLLLLILFWVYYCRR